MESQEKLTPEEVEEARTAIFAKWKSKKCPLCDSSELRVDDILTSEVLLHRKPVSLKIFGVTYVLPTVTVVCTVCGYVLHFDAEIAGISVAPGGEAQNG